MRIALIITELHPGGAETCFVNLAIYLRDQGHEVAVWELWPPPPADKRRLTNRLDQEGIVWKSGGAVRPWHFVTAARWLRKELHNFAPDVVQAFLFHGNLAAAFASRNRPWRLFGGARVRQPERFRQRLQKIASWRMEKLICVSHGVLDHCRQVEHIADHKLAVIPNGIALPVPVPPATELDTELNKLGISPATRLLLFVGRLTEQKGIEALMLQADALLESLPRHELVIVGDGRLQSRLEQIRSQAGSGRRIHLPGWSSIPLAWIQRCEQLLLPAEYEGMPNVVLEAMACGKPVVAFDVEGVRELLGTGPVADNQAIPPGNFAQFSAAIERLAHDPTLRNTCSQHNFDRVANNFLLEKQLARYQALYTSS
ncbi:MAG: glycosyltransferase [Pirellulaceae bacterium]